MAVYNDVTTEVLDYFVQKMDDCKKAGIHDVIIDPGFGFAKNSAHNFKLLKELSCFKNNGTGQYWRGFHAKQPFTKHWA